MEFYPTFQNRKRTSRCFIFSCGKLVPSMKRLILQQYVLIPEGVLQIRALGMNLNGLPNLPLDP